MNKGARVGTQVQCHPKCRVHISIFLTYDFLCQSSLLGKRLFFIENYSLIFRIIMFENNIETFWNYVQAKITKINCF